MEMFDVEDFRQHAEMCLKEACSIDELTVDEDGDWPIMVRDVPLYVRVFDDHPRRVQVFTTIASDVSPDAWAGINHLNLAILDHALESIASYALDCGPMLQTVFGSTATVAAQRFLRFAEAHPELDFYLIGPGCGRAGFDDSVGAWMFEGSPSNVIKPEGW